MVVLNLFVEYLPGVVSETFTLTLLTAVLLKCVRDVILLLKQPIVARVRGAATRSGRVLAGLLLWVVIVGSTFVVMEVVDLVFGNRVRLGGFLAVTGLVLSLVVSRWIVRRALLQDHG